MDLGQLGWDKMLSIIENHVEIDNHTEIEAQSHICYGKYKENMCISIHVIRCKLDALICFEAFAFQFFHD